MKLGEYFYQIEFADGRVIRRECVSRAIAMAAEKFCAYEMILLQVTSVEWGKM